MYAPRAFAQTDLALLDWLLARDAFVTLISQDEGGQPAISHCRCCTGAMARTSSSKVIGHDPTRRRAHLARR